MTPHLHIVEDDQPHLVHVSSLPALIADRREVMLNAAQMALLSEAAGVLREQGFRLYPPALDGVVRSFAAAASTPSCSCGGSGVCTVCVITELEGEQA